MSVALTSCAVCSGTSLSVFLERTACPILANRLYDTANEAVAAPRGEIVLAGCATCGAVQNIRFEEDAVRYDAGYENSLHFSAAFKAYSETLAQSLAQAGDLCGEEVVDIGCGQGEFLALLCRRSGCRGTGIDPSLTEETGRGGDGSIRLLNRKVGDVGVVTEATRLVICRHVLEHLARPGELLQAVAHAAGADSQARFYVEVPNATWMLGNRSIWDVIYEHPIGFTAGSLAWLLRENGFDVTDLHTAFGDQFLCAAGRLSGGAPARFPHHDAAHPVPAPDVLARFHDATERIPPAWDALLASQHRAGRRIALWGIGSKGVMFLNTLHEPTHISQAVDRNPRKQGRYIAGTGHRVSPPHELPAAAPDLVLVSNGNYVPEIEHELLAMGLQPELRCIGDGVAVDMHDNAGHA